MEKKKNLAVIESNYNSQIRWLVFVGSGRCGDLSA